VLNKLLKYLGFNKEPQPNIVNYTDNWVGRKLMDGTYVLEDKNKPGYAADLNDPQYMWKPGYRGYKYCIAKNKEELDKLAMPALARRGISK